MFRHDKFFINPNDSKYDQLDFLILFLHVTNQKQIVFHSKISAQRESPWV